MQNRQKIILTPLEQAQTLVLSFLSNMDVLHVPLEQADQYYSALDVVSPMAVPPFDSSMMDGYTLRTDDWKENQKLMPLSGRLAAGDVSKPLSSGTAMRIFTGAPLPIGADTVVMQEACTLSDDQTSVTIHQKPEPGAFINRTGQDIAQGTTVLSTGDLLNAARIALLASLGIAQVAVYRRPRIALITTGNELVEPDKKLEYGQIYNSNRYMLELLLRSWGGDVCKVSHIKDDRQTTHKTLEALASQHDLLVTTGGVSMGEEDHVRAVLQAYGSLQLWQLAIKPGKPLTYGLLGGCHMVGLPGNPVSAFVTALLIIRPMLLKMRGAINPTSLFTLPAFADFDYPKPDMTRREFLRVKASYRQEKLWLSPYSNQKSAVLSSISQSDGLLDNPANHAFQRGTPCRFIPISQSFTGLSS